MLFWWLVRINSVRIESGMIYWWQLISNQACCTFFLVRTDMQCTSLIKVLFADWADNGRLVTSAVSQYRDIKQPVTVHHAQMMMMMVLLLSAANGPLDQGLCRSSLNIQISTRTAPVHLLWPSDISTISMYCTVYSTMQHCTVNGDCNRQRWMCCTMTIRTALIIKWSWLNIIVF